MSLEELPVAIILEQWFIKIFVSSENLFVFIHGGFFFLNTEFWFCSHFLLVLEICFSLFFLALWFLVRNVQLFEFLFMYK